MRLFNGLQPVTIDEVRPLFEAHHGYGGVSKTSTYAYGYFEGGVAVAAVRCALRSSCATMSPSESESSSESSSEFRKRFP